MTYFLYDDYWNYMLAIQEFLKFYLDLGCPSLGGSHQAKSLVPKYVDLMVSPSTNRQGPLTSVVCGVWQRLDVVPT